jgi:hypothetical protein
MTALEQHEKDAADLAAAQALIATLTQERDANAATVAAAQATIAERDATLTAQAGEIVTLKASVADLTAKRATEAKAHEETRDKLGLARQALANPSFAAAARQGLGIDKVTAEGSPAAEPVEGEPTTAKEAHKMYNAIDSRDGRALEAFRNKHAVLLGLK